MNKEEIKKSIKVVFNEDCKECYFPKRKCASCVREEEKKIKRYIKFLEQKESILDKVTDTLKEEMKKAKEQIKYYEKQYSISKERESGFYIKSFHRQINRWQSRFETCREILNIIEGEKNNGK